MLNISRCIMSNFTFTIDNIDYTDYLISWNISHDRKFGSATASFVLDNNRILGRWDRVDFLSAKEAVIIDFKSSHINKQKEENN